ncbi:uncharacterized protein LOC120357954 [Solenopsis invicta]|uniref:uncharacterized protein LOC120357954 n=1 Tax=Solenopsis invicta TaxID=13686 RepID=UPI00193D4523|nr:uncharacterized protein LOC120357954 [Solenopsis invicta]
MVENIHVQVKDNSPSIENILRPLSYTSWLMGVGVAHPRKFPKAVTTIIRVIHLVMCFIHMAYGSITFLIIDINVDFGYEKIYMFMHYMNWTISYVSTYYYIYHGIRKYDKWPELMDRMKKLDQKIRREIPMNDQPIKNAEAIAILAAYACCPLFPIVHTVFCYLTHSEDMFAYKWFFYYMLAQSLVNSFVFDVIVYVIYYRFQTINKVIEQLDALSDASWIVHKIRQIRELHNSMFQLILRFVL